MSAAKKRAATAKARARKGSKKSGARGVIEVRGARQNNLKGVDVDIPLGQFSVVTGPSGSGKSSLAFQTVYAEGQRRYVETFSPYTRQFFERMDKPDVEAIHGIPPAIAIGQGNNVKTTRSTVGTITEINDYLKILFPRVAEARCPVCEEKVEPDTPAGIARAARKLGDSPLMVTFAVAAPADAAPADFLAFLNGQGYLRILVFGEVYRTDDPDAYGRKTLPAQVDVIQDRVAGSKRTRLLEAVESAMRLGGGEVTLVDGDGERHAFSHDWRCAPCGIDLVAPSPGIFSFNSPQGACPDCRGFGRVIGIDLEKAIPDRRLSIRGGAVRAFQGERGAECQRDLERAARTRGLDLDCPFRDLSDEDQSWVRDGEAGDPEDNWREGSWYGVRGFLRLAGDQVLQDAHPRFPQPIPVLHQMPGLLGHAIAARGPQFPHRWKDTS